ncbi:MAG TPA: outer membrane lipoprotein-sorting protein [Bryocella sp.]|nr:outer membrane lipoprotein-sorting protein [Bryocella sp.]
MSLRHLSIVAALLISPFAASAQSPQLKSILDQMDTASAHFKNAQANVRYDNYTRVVNDHDIETGSIYVERTGSTEQMGAVFYNTAPDGKPANTPARIVNFDGGTLRIFTLGTNQVDLFKAGANQARYDSFLTLGFGGSGKDLARSWNINDQGADTIDGVKTEKLDLVSKDPSVKNMFTHITIWIDAARGVSLKQVFYAPNGDNRTANYSNIRLNSSVNKKPYSISSKAQVITH